VPTTLFSAMRTASSSVSVSFTARAIRWAITSVSVSLTKDTPSASRRCRRSSAFSMMPLCTTAMRSAASRWGCALMSLGSPCVAQRVCPMPVVPLKRAGTVAARSATRPLVLRTLMPLFATAIPAES